MAEGNKMAGLAVVLGGGGLKGAYQLGVWRGLRELGISYDVVVGTSIGALNGALMAQGSYEEAEKLWQDICYEKVFAGQKYPEIEKIDSRFTMIEHTIHGILWAGGLDVSPLRQLIAEYLDEGKLRASSVDFGLVAAKLTRGIKAGTLVGLPEIAIQAVMLREIPQGRVCDYLLASSACFPVFKPWLIEDCYYIDGGFCDDLPIDLALKANPQELLVVDLEAIGAHRHTLPVEIKARLLRCKWELGPLFCFERGIIDRNILLGYHDCLKAYGAYEGGAYTFKKGEQAKTYQRVKMQRRISLDRRNLKRLTSRIQQELNKTKRRTHLLIKEPPPSASELLCGLAEAAGRVFMLPADRVYCFEEFDAKLLEAYHALLYPEAIVRDGSALSGLKELLGKLDQRTLTVLLTRLYLAGEIKEYIDEISLLAPLAMGAALYMATLADA